MTGPLKLKIHTKHAILKVLARDSRANETTLIASLSLETGFRKQTITQIIDNLVDVGAVRRENGWIYPISVQPEILMPPEEKEEDPDGEERVL
jgi:hypothetical protein